MRKLFCYGKKDFCDQAICSGACEFHDGSGCEYRKIETIADRIRSMTDEELAKWLMKANDGELYIKFCKETPECMEMLERYEIPEERCLGCMIDWLQQPAEPTPPATMTDEKEDSGLVEED